MECTYTARGRGWCILASKLQPYIDRQCLAQRAPWCFLEVIQSLEELGWVAACPLRQPESEGDPPWASISERDRCPQPVRCVMTCLAIAHALSTVFSTYARTCTYRPSYSRPSRLPPSSETITTKCSLLLTT